MGMVVPAIDELEDAVRAWPARVAFIFEACADDCFILFTALFLAIFFTADLFLAACLEGIGMVICAVAGAETAINASVLAAAISLLFTIPTPIEVLTQ
jgi:hypothetical protein